MKLNEDIKERINAHPLVAQLVSAFGKNIRVFSKKSGVNDRSIDSWVYSGTCPTLANFEAVANAMGYELKLVKKQR